MLICVMRNSIEIIAAGHIARASTLRKCNAAYPYLSIYLFNLPYFKTYIEKNTQKTNVESKNNIFRAILLLSEKYVTRKTCKAMPRIRHRNPNKYLIAFTFFLFCTSFWGRKRNNENATKAANIKSGIKSQNISLPAQCVRYKNVATIVPIGKRLLKQSAAWILCLLIIRKSLIRVGRN